MSPTTNLIRIYYHGKYAWQNHALDVAEACEAAVSVQRKSLKFQAQSHHAAQEMQIKGQQAAQEQHEEMRGVLEAQSEELMGIRAGLEEMTGEIRQGMSLIVDRLDGQLKLFSQAVHKLEQINQTLRTPRATEANELYDQGERWFSQGLFEESLDAFLKAEQIYKVNHFLQFRIGSLFLEGANGKSNVIDISRAEPHLLLATRYAESQQPSDSTTQRICGDAYYRAGKAAYLLGEERRKASDVGGVEDCLNRALGHLAKAVQVWPGNTPTVYWQAKCYALLGQKQRVMEKFGALSDRNRKYFADAMEDGDFVSFQEDIRNIFIRALDSPGPQVRIAHARLSATQAQLNRAFEALAWTQRSDATLGSQNARLQTTGNRLNDAEKQLRGLDIDIESLLLEVSRIARDLDDLRHELDNLTEKTLATKIANIEQQMSALRSQKNDCENRIASCRREMAQTQGSGGMGCLFAFIFYLIFQVGAPLIVVTFGIASLRMTPGMGMLFLVVFVGVLISGYKTGTWISRNNKNSSPQKALNAAHSALAEWNRTAPSAIQQANTEWQALTQQMEQFSIWRKSNPVAVLKS